MRCRMSVRRNDVVEAGTEHGEVLPKPVKKWRAVVSQFLATTAKNMLMLNVGFMTAFATIFVGETHNAGAGLSLSDKQASWFGVIMEGSNPVGSLFSGVIVTRLGCKLPMAFVNVPFVAAWLCFYWAQTPAVVFSAQLLTGLSFGLSEAPTKSYAGEVCQPALRGPLIAFSCIFYYLGLLLAYSIATVLTWRNLALVSTAVPIASFVCIMLVPESPIWLVYRGMYREAEASLCWLRGWVRPSAVSEELNELIRHSREDKSRVRDSPRKFQDGTKTPNSTGRELRAAVRMLATRGTVLPMLLVLGSMLLTLMASGSAMDIFLVEVYKELQLPLGPYATMSLLSFLKLSAILASSLFLSRLGLRRVALASTVGVGACQLCLAGYMQQGWICPWLPQILVVFNAFFYSFGMIPLPWILVCAVFPFRSRALASGICTAVFHVFYSMILLLYLPMEGAVGLSGVFWIFTGSSVLCFAFIYWCVPETEGKSLQEIEKFFTSEQHCSPSLPEEHASLSLEVKGEDVTARKLFPDSLAA